MRRRRIAVDRTEVALAVDEQVAHRERLGHAHQGVVGRDIAVRMIFTEHVADDARAFHVGAGRDVIALVHREQDAAMHGLQPVAHVGQRTPDDHAHRIVEIRLPHLVFEIDVQYFAGDFSHESS